MIYLGLMSLPERAWLHRQCAVRGAGELRGRAGRDPARLRVRWSRAFAAAGVSGVLLQEQRKIIRGDGAE